MQGADIAFLDVEMPGLNGIQVGAELKKRNPACKIFIVTPYPDYLDDAMRFQVFRYLSKPIDKTRLFRNLKDAIYQSIGHCRRHCAGEIAHQKASINNVTCIRLIQQQV